MNQAQRSSLATVAAEALGRLGGKASLDDVALTIHTQHPDVYRDVTWRAFRHAVRSALSAADTSGLPAALSIDDQGTYMQRRLFSVDDYRVTVKRFVRLGAANLDRARALAAECEDIYGHHIDIDAELRAEHAEWRSA